MLSRISNNVQSVYSSYQILRESKTACFFLDTYQFVQGGIGIIHLIRSDYSYNSEANSIRNRAFWRKNAWKINDLLGNISLVMSGMISSPSLSIWKWCIQIIFTPMQLEQLSSHSPVSGKNLIRSICLISYLIGIPSTLQTFYSIYSWVYRSYQRRKQIKERKNQFQLLKWVKRPQAVVTMKTLTETAYKLIKHSPRK